MSIQDFDAMVLAHIRKYVPEGGVQATVSPDFAQLWLDASDTLNPKASQIASINYHSGWADDSGTLTYQLNPALKGLSVLIPTRPRDFGDAVVMDVSDGLFD